MVPSRLRFDLCSWEEPNIASLATLPPESLLATVLRQGDLLQKLRGYVLAAPDEPAQEEGVDDDEVVDADFAETRASRVTAQHLWSLGGSATGEQSLEIARQRAKEKKRKAEEKAAKAIQRDA